jgi:hypothetical protein
MEQARTAGVDEIQGRVDCYWEGIS